MRAPSPWVCIAAVCALAHSAEPPRTAQAWLAALPPLPATAEQAYAQWSDAGGTLTPAPASEKIAAQLRAQILSLARPIISTTTSSRTVSTHDQALLRQITEFPATAALQRDIQAARRSREVLEQKWHGELT